MRANSKKMVFIKATCWLGIAADALWAVGLLIPEVFAALTGNTAFNPDFQTRQILGIGGSLMAGWTCLLIWTLRDPIKRRVVLLLTAFPVVAGLFIVTLIGYLNGDTGNIWILVKTLVLFIAMAASYHLAGSMGRVSDKVAA